MLSRFGKCMVFLLTLGMLASAQTVPPELRITVRTDSQINSASAHVGQSFNAKLLREPSGQWQDHCQAGAPAKAESCLCQVKWTAARPRAGHHPTHLDSTGGW